jgi:N-methylhydantoinase A
MVQAAEAILRVANSRMAGAIRLVSIERGFDPKRFAFMPFGGGGALHAGAMLADVGLARAIVPRYPGVTSAMGCVIADMRHDFVQTINTLAGDVDEAALGALMQRHHDDGMAMLAASGTRFDRRLARFEMDMAYIGQTHTVAVPLPVRVDNGTVTPPGRDAIAAAFDAAYRATYGRLLEGGVRRVLNLRSAVIGERPKFDLASLAPRGTGTAEDARTGTRKVHFGDAWHETAIYARLDLPVGAVIDGPAILEQPDSTILIEPDLRGSVDGFGNVIIEAKP